MCASPEIIERYLPGQVLWAGPSAGSRSAHRLQEALAQIELDFLPVESGQALYLGDGTQLEVLAISERGAVLLLTHGNFRLLLADSGYGPSNPPEWLEALNSQLVLLSVAADGYEGRPDPAVLEAVEGRNLLRMDRSGWIEVVTDGKQMWVEVERR